MGTKIFQYKKKLFSPNIIYICYICTWKEDMLTYKHDYILKKTITNSGWVYFKNNLNMQELVYVGLN